MLIIGIILFILVLAFLNHSSQIEYSDSKGMDVKKSDIPIIIGFCIMCLVFVGIAAAVN